ncbi:MAG: V-type ATP synthase subunit E [Treponemataceae bacterium]|nr:V-type ATP synthase subunit E [Treponemataceae bacterium]
MEELRSTEILDKEIQADARKKAERILAKAEADSKNLIASVPARIAQVREEQQAKYGERISAYEREQDASLPLEQERFLVSFIQSAMDDATNRYLESMSEAERLNLALRQMKQFENNLKSKKFNVFVYGFQQELVKKALDKKVDVVSYEATEFNKMIVEDDCGITNKEGVILEAVDKSVRCRFTIPEVVSQLQSRCRAELYGALFDGRLGSR